ncbi:MAG: serine/threonine protein kinase [Chloroflexi bacterium]|nr:serine/threonine protein kinase [Chloroflexota bacterium]
MGAKLAALQQAEMRLPLTEATRIAINLCDAVDYAHQRRMIHRDIKPANVMINLLGEPILMDFGIARLVGQPLTALDEQTALGTALYMSPEQALGNAVDYRADIYSLGALIYEMLDGRPPFPGDSIQHILDQQISAAVPDLFAANSNLPQTLITIVERALENSRSAATNLRPIWPPLYKRWPSTCKTPGNSRLSPFGASGPPVAASQRGV